MGEIIYEINSGVPLNIGESAYLEWLGPHIQEIMACEGFKSYEVFSREEEDKNYKYFTVLFRLINIESLEGYFKNHAPRLRQQVVDRFGKDHGIKYTRRNLTKVDV